MSSYKEENRKRLINLLEHVKAEKHPNGWRHVTSIAVGGLLSVGFSKVETHLLLVISSSGRGLIDSSTGNKIERDYEEYEGLDEWDLTCKGIGTVQDETITICGLNGGGLPQSNSAGETLEVVSPNWPEQDLILCREHKCSLIDGHQSYCNKIYTEHLRGFGFSWCGNYIVAACGSDFDIWQRIEKL
ncbi:MAG: hypothetical protein ACRBHB_25190 [Arenicella sp.]